MSEPVALIAEPDLAMRALMRRTLETAGFASLDSSDAAQLSVTLRTRRALMAPRALLVVAAPLLAPCVEQLSALAEQRSTNGLPAPQLVLTCEFGALSGVKSPQLPGCSLAGILEKPFEFSLLQAIAFRCRTMSLEAARSSARD